MSKKSVEGNPYNYAKWSRRRLIEHAKCLSESIHELASQAMQQEHELKKLRPCAERLAAIDEFREFLHGGAI